MTATFTDFLHRPCACIEHIECTTHGAQKIVSIACQPDASARLFEELLLELCDRISEVRLTDVQLLCGLSIVLEARQRFKIP